MVVEYSFHGKNKTEFEKIIEFLDKNTIMYNSKKTPNWSVNRLGNDFEIGYNYSIVVYPNNDNQMSMLFLKFGDIFKKCIF